MLICDYKMWEKEKKWEGIHIFVRNYVFFSVMQNIYILYKMKGKSNSVC